MKIMRKLFVIILCVLGSITSVKSVEILSNRISVEKGGDSSQASYYFIDAGFDFDDSSLSFGYGESDDRYETTVLDTKTKQISISSDPLNDSSVSLSYSDWGQEGEINISTIAIGFVRNLGDWSFSLSPKSRKIELRTLFAFRPVINLDSSGVDLGVVYYGKGWSMGLDYSKNNYSRDVSILATDPRLVLIFSPATLDHASGVEKNRTSADITYLLKWGSIGADHSRSISAVDDSVSTSTALSIHYKVNRSWSVRLRGGQTDNSFSTQTTNFSSLSLNNQF